MNSSNTTDAARAIRAAADSVNRVNATALSAHDLTPQQYQVLRILRTAEDGRLPTLEIGDYLVEHAPGVTRLLDRMAAKQLVTRTRAENDRRVVMCEITSHGVHVVDAARIAVDQVHARAFDGFEPDEIDTLVEMLEAVALALR